MIALQAKPHCCSRLCFRRCGKILDRFANTQSTPTTQSRTGDWTCSKCGAEGVFASRSSCFKCGAPKPKIEPTSSAAKSAKGRKVQSTAQSKTQPQQQPRLMGNTSQHRGGGGGGGNKGRNKNEKSSGQRREAKAKNTPRPGASENQASTVPSQSGVLTQGKVGNASNAKQQQQQQRRKKPANPASTKAVSSGVSGKVDGSGLPQRERRRR